MLYSAVSQPRPLPAIHAGTFGSTEAVQSTVVPPAWNQHAARRGAREAASDLDRAKLVGLAVVVTHVHVTFRRLLTLARLCSPKPGPRPRFAFPAARPGFPSARAGDWPACCDDDALRAVDHFVGHFLAAVGRQAVHEVGVAGRAPSARRSPGRRRNRGGVSRIRLPGPCWSRRRCRRPRRRERPRPDRR